jgi:hypothetical protein
MSFRDRFGRERNSGIDAAPDHHCA